MLTLLLSAVILTIVFTTYRRYARTEKTRFSGIMSLLIVLSIPLTGAAAITHIGWQAKLEYYNTTSAHVYASDIVTASNGADLMLFILAVLIPLVLLVTNASISRSASLSNPSEATSEDAQSPADSSENESLVTTADTASRDEKTPVTV